MAPPLNLSLRPSYYLATALVLAHTAAATAVAAVDFPPWLAIGLWCAIGASCVSTVYRFALLKSAHSIIGIELREGADAVFAERSGHSGKARVLGSTFVAPYLTVLNLKEEEAGGARHALILPDSLDAEEFRRLRVRLRWQRPAEVH